MYDESVSSIKCQEVIFTGRLSKHTTYMSRMINLIHGHLPHNYNTFFVSLKTVVAGY